jgi:phosphoglycerate dehydrogenase-like enzyme
MIETIYITDPDDPLVPLISEAARGRLNLRLHPPHETLERSPGADAVLVGDHRLPVPIIRLTGARLVQLTRGDHPDVDVVSLTEVGVAVAGASLVLAPIVADYTLGLIAAITDPSGPRGEAARELIVQLTKNDAQLTRLKGLGVGVVGFGRVGQHVVSRVKRLGAVPVIADIRTPSHDPMQQLGVRRYTLDRLLSGCDVVSLHVPWGPTADPLIGARELRLMPETAVLLNTADARVVDNDALASEIAAGSLSGAALDVRPDLLGAAGQRLAVLSEVLITPYVAGRSPEGDGAVAEFVVANIERAMRGEQPLGLVELNQFPRTGDPAFWPSRMAPRV